MKNTVNINYAKVFDTQRTLNSLGNIFNNFDFYRHFEEMEKYLGEVNLNHDNCLIYKESIDTIYRDLDIIRNILDELYTSLKKTSVTFIDREELSAGKIDKLLKMYPNSSLTAELVEASNSTVTTIPDAQPVQEENEINTVPIGIAIGATGILGSIGAVVVDSLYGPKTKTVKSSRPVEQFEEYNSYSDDDYYSGSSSEQYQSDSYLDEYNTPSYTAVRDNRESSQFYGNNKRLDDNESNVEMSSKMKDVEPSKEIDLSLEDEDEESSNEDFY